MFAIIGIIIVFGSVIGGYLMEHGNIRVLVQPAELVVIGGAAIGTVLIANPLHILKQIVAGVVGVFAGSTFTKQRYLESLKMTYELLNKARREGLMALEADVEDPAKSPIFSKYPAFLKDHHVRDYFCDTMRMAITGVEAFDLDQLLDLDMEVHHQGASLPVASLSTMADALPGLGIVAAVLGRRDHHGSARRSAGRNRPQSRRRPGGHLSRNPALLRFGGATRRQHAEEG